MFPTPRRVGSPSTALLLKDLVLPAAVSWSPLIYQLAGLVITEVAPAPAVSCVKVIVVSLVYVEGVRDIFNVPAAIAAAKAT